MISDKKAKPQTVLLDGDQLPAICPNPAMGVWNTHPKVYLDVTRTGKAACPYCGTVYALKPGAKVHSH